ncbi:hypothetical protein [Anaeroselena agilis]|uniref:Uncharacterized protein n=1 Tax=Anaeroselena agilis TaxID=3063788 RepID=A0ABU3NVU5_9FIRM|nr:hypothetical protein [Selenomonadales bacterium 4137-cl]
MDENTKPTVDYLQKLCDVIVLNTKEYLGVAAVWSNPEHYGNPDYRLPTPTGTYATFVNNVTALKATIKAGDHVTPNFINALVGYQTTLDANVKTLFTGDTFTDMVPLPAVDEPFKGPVLNAIVQNLNIISNNFDQVNGWWNSNDYCARTCQVACQSSCQIACQGCYSGTCHVQNCGGWS